MLQWMVDREFRGYDPYDGCNTRHALLKRWRSSRLLLTYFNKFSPVNLRRFLGVEPSVNVYALALTVTAMLRNSPDTPQIELARRLVTEVLSRSLVAKYGEHCWSGNGIFIQTRTAYHTPDVPGIIGTEAVVEALLAYARFNPHDDHLRDVLLSVRRFCLEHLLVERHNTTYFRYKPDVDPYMVTFNAAMKAATLVTEVNRRYQSEEGNDAVRRTIEFLLQYQNPDGSWNYSVDLRTGRQRRQVDFHQGFILDGLLTHLDAFGPNREVEGSIGRGLSFYRNHQFLPSGQSLYRHPRTWPTNIHNQAQGIVTFTRADERFPDSLEFAHTIARWTLEEMYDGNGRFHYMKYPGFSNRITYFRWNQAWMLYALTRLMEGSSDAGTVEDGRKLGNGNVAPSRP